MVQAIKSGASSLAYISPEPIYDFQTIPVGAQGQPVQFFRRGLSAGRTVADTNLETGGHLPSDRLKSIAEVTVMAAFVGETAAAVADAMADMHRLSQQAALIVYHSNNPILRIPVGLCGGGFGATGLAGIGADAGSGLIILGNPGAKGFKIPQADWVPIKGADEFYCEIEWSGDMQPTFAEARRIGVAIGGPLATKGGR